MTKHKIKNLLDYIPFLILVISAIVLLWAIGTTDSGVLWKHIVGLCFLPIIFLAFRWQHKIGVLVLGFALLIGLVGLLSYSPAVATWTVTFGKTSESQSPIFYGQPIFLLWLVIHFILSGRYYFGIATKKYWQNLLGEPIESNAD